MKFPAAMVTALSLATPVEAQPRPDAPRVAPSVVYEVAPALGGYTDQMLFGDLWRRAELSVRDRSLATVTMLITGGQVHQLPFHLNRSLDNGLTEGQLAETITHLAFHTGWPRAMSAIPVAKAAFAARAAARVARRHRHHPCRHRRGAGRQVGRPDGTCVGPAVPA